MSGKRYASVEYPQIDKKAARSLYRLNAAASLLHGALAISAMVALLAHFQGSGYWTLAYPVFDEFHWTATYRMAWLVPLFHAISCATHLSYATFRRNAYEVHMGETRNPYRWVEYTLSAGVMVWLIANLSGVGNPVTLSLLVLVNACMQYTGHAVETLVRDKSGAQAIRQMYGLGGALHLATWAYIFGSFFLALTHDRGSPPDAVWAIAPSLFLVFSAFAWPLHRWTRRATGTHTARAYINTVEKPYAVLSLLAKASLGAFIYGGVLRPRE